MNILKKIFSIVFLLIFFQQNVLCADNTLAPPSLLQKPVVEESFGKIEIFGMSPASGKTVFLTEGTNRPLDVSVKVRLGNVKVDDVDVVVCYGPAVKGAMWEEIKITQHKKINRKKGIFLFQGKIAGTKFTRQGRYGLTVKVTPKGVNQEQFTKWHNQPGNDAVIIVRGTAKVDTDYHKQPEIPAIDRDTKRPIIYELSARSLGKRFSQITDEEIRAIAKRYNYLWMMGVWEESDFSRRLNQHYDQERSASAYAIPDYRINPELGGEEEFKEFVGRCNHHGLKVIIDFVPNHMSADSPWIKEHPEWFMLAPSDTSDVPEDPITDALTPYYRFLHPRKIEFEWRLRRGAGFLERLTDVIKNIPRICVLIIGSLLGMDIDVYLNGRWIIGPGPVAYHGKDPHYPRWGDTAQLNYANEGLRRHVVEVLKKIAELTNGGGVRCDMVMLTLRGHIKRFWFPQMTEDDFNSLMPEEFWQEAITEVKKLYPNFKFIGETYWGKEGRIQELGFDVTYDKYLCEILREGNIGNLRSYLCNVTLGYLKKTLHFLANHDEGSAKEKFGDRERAAAVIMATLPGGLLIPEGQEEGFREYMSANYIWRQTGETPDRNLMSFYQSLLHMASGPLFSEGTVECFISPENTIVYTRTLGDQKALVVANYSAESKDISIDKGILGDIELRQIFSANYTEHTGNNENISLPPYEVKVFMVKNKVIVPAGQGTKSEPAMSV